MATTVLRGANLALTAFACLAVGAWCASASGETASTHAVSALRCYATPKNPTTPVCYHFSAKAEYRHGRIVYVPILIQVPVPPHPPAVIIVNSLDDIHPNTDP